jgi:hypothetical protein
VTSGPTRWSRVERDDPAGRWLVGAGIIFLSGIAAAFGAGLLGSTWLAVVVGIAIMVAGGALAAREVRPGLSPRGVIGTLLLPLPILLPAWFLMVGLSEGTDDAPSEAGLIALGLFVIWEASFILVAVGSHVVRDRARERLHYSAWSPAEGDLAAATDEGRAGTIVREYPDDEWGRSQLEADASRLARHDYGLVSVDERAGTPESIRMLQLVVPLPGLDIDGPAIVATFQHGHQQATLPPTRRDPAAVAPRPRMGRRSRRAP